MVLWQSDANLVWKSPYESKGGGQRVLIVDDDPNLTRLLGVLLRSAGFESIFAHDGPSGLDAAESEKPDVIILDLRMPCMDGRAVYRELRARGVATPVLIASAYGARRAYAELGAQGWIEKPFEPDALIEAIVQQLNAKLTR